MTPPIIIPAEALQAEEPAPPLSPRFGLGLLALVAVLVGSHWAWVLMGMPGASSSTTGALVLRTEPASSLVASRFHHLAGDAK